MMDTLTVKTSFLKMADNAEIALYDWSHISEPIRAMQEGMHTVLILHGLGEHALRYAPLAGWLIAQGYKVLAYDQFGHGRSSGARGALTHNLQLIEHLQEIIHATRAKSGATNSKITVLGHSLGGLVAASATARGLLSAAQLVLSSPALAVDLKPWQRVAVKWLAHLAPKLTLANGLNPRYLSHDESIVEAYVADPFVHNRICARLGAFIAEEGAFVIHSASEWPLPTLLLYAGDDHLVSTRGSRAFYASSPRALVQAECFSALYHEIFNELNATPVFNALGAWLARAG